MNDTPPPTLKEKLLAEIKSGSISMRPRIVFTAKFIGTLVVAFAAVFTTILIFNFIVFSVRISGQEMLLGFGARGVETFLWFFPWYLLVVDVALIALLQWLIRQFRLGYHIPVLYVVLGLLVGSSIIGYTLDRATPFNDNLHERREHLPPPFRGFYEGVRKPFPRGSGICKCTVTAIHGNVITVLDARDATTTLVVELPRDSVYATTSGLKVGDTIFIAGEEEGGVIQAFGVRKVPFDMTDR